MTTNSVTRVTDLGTVAEVAAQLRVDSVRLSTSAGSGHPTSSMSAADLIALLVARHLRYDWDAPHSRANDHLVFSKGHASPLLYSVFKAAGVVIDEELMTGYRRFGQRLEGQPTPIRLPTMACGLASEVRFTEAGTLDKTVIKGGVYIRLADFSFVGRSRPGQAARRAALREKQCRAS